MAFPYNLERTLMKIESLNHYQNIVVLTGAGISAESGLKTFRDSDGLWEGHRVEEVATPEAYEQSPETVHRFYNARRQQLINKAKPNKAHTALAEFEQHFKGSFLLVTQNVDNLHELAGSISVLHMHGELLKVKCLNCKKIFHWEEDLTTNTRCSDCQTLGALRPDIVWFGELPKYMKKIENSLNTCDLFVSIGTSGNVYPAAGFTQIAKLAGAQTLELNLESTTNGFFDESIEGKAGELIPKYFIA